jgi:hypothetical protein
MTTAQSHEAWNKGKLIGQKAPLKPKDVWVIRICLQNAHAVHDLSPYSTLQSTANCAAATSSICESAMLPTATKCCRGR